MKILLNLIALALLVASSALAQQAPPEQAPIGSADAQETRRIFDEIRRDIASFDEDERGRAAYGAFLSWQLLAARFSEGDSARGLIAYSRTSDANKLRFLDRLGLVGEAYLLQEDAGRPCCVAAGVLIAQSYLVAVADDTDPGLVSSAGAYLQTMVDKGREVARVAGHFKNCPDGNALCLPKPKDWP